MTGGGGGVAVAAAAVAVVAASCCGGIGGVNRLTGLVGGFNFSGGT